MLSRVLRSDRAVQVNIAIMRAFVRLRELSATHADLARKLEDATSGTAKQQMEFAASCRLRSASGWHSASSDLRPGYSAITPVEALPLVRQYVTHLRSVSSSSSRSLR